jgi:hypothetical protein
LKQYSVPLRLPLEFGDQSGVRLTGTASAQLRAADRAQSQHRRQSRQRETRKTPKNDARNGKRRVRCRKVRQALLPKNTTETRCHRVPLEGASRTKPFELSSSTMRRFGRMIGQTPQQSWHRGRVTITTHLPRYFCFALTSTMLRNKRDVEIPSARRSTARLSVASNWSERRGSYAGCRVDGVQNSPRWSTKECRVRQQDTLEIKCWLRTKC